MVTTRFIQLVLVACSVVTLSSASSPQTDLEKRDPLELQVEGGLLGGLLGPLAGPTTAADPTSSTSTKAPSSTSQPTSTTSNTPSQTSSSSASTSAPPSSSASNPPSTTSQPATAVTTFFTVTSTNTDGSINTIESSAVTGPTNTPNKGDGGMSPETRNTIIGVAVGVGGAIALCALGIVAYRIWGRRRNEVDNEDLMNYGTAYGSSGMEKSDAGGSSSGRTPFQSTLESYHNPTPVNASSNF